VYGVAICSWPFAPGRLRRRSGGRREAVGEPLTEVEWRPRYFFGALRSFQGVVKNVRILKVIHITRMALQGRQLTDRGHRGTGYYQALFERLRYRGKHHTLLKLRQRVVIDVQRRSTGSTMLGTPVTLPIAIAPAGLAGMQ
jgi:hypothetical protein